jgi:MoCo/4Fe-4S cofactor protein with predicted Tat translocation signal
LLNVPPVEQTQTGKQYWRSLDDLADTPQFRQFVENEFPNFAPDLLRSPNRRQFLKLMAASLALGGLTGCRWPEENITPYAYRPPGCVPGKPKYFATAMDLAGVGRGLLVTSYDGRPIKVDGNPRHPQERGSSDAITQASILELYDPDRSRYLVRSDRGRDTIVQWADFEQFIRPVLDQLKQAGGKGLGILAEASSSPSVARLRRKLQEQYPQAGWHEYEPISRDNERVGTQWAFGSPHRVHLALDKAEAIVCFDDDPLMTHPAAVQYARDFVAGRQPDDARMSRLYVVESVFSVTGSMADHRYAVQSRSIPFITCCLIAELVARHGVRLPTGSDALRAALRPFENHPQRPSFVGQLAEELAQASGRCIISAGPRQPAEVHALVAVLNAALDNVDKTVRYTAEPDPDRPTHIESIQSLAADMKADSVDALIILGGNPAFDAPADLEFARLLRSVSTTIHLSQYRNETSRLCRWHLPRAHWLESWGDARSYDGTISIIQPLIAPLYNGRSPIELLSLLLGEQQTKGYDIVRQTFHTIRGNVTFESAWRHALHDGLVADSAWPNAAPAPRVRNWADRLAAFANDGMHGGESEVTFCQDHSIYDGRFANNGWLQEMSDPMTKLAWGNAAVVSPGAADRLGIKLDDVVRLEVNGRPIELPAFIMPGQADDSIMLHVGYGRQHSGRVGDGVGIDVYCLRSCEAMHAAGAVQISKTGRSAALACTQDHHAIDTIGREGAKQRLGELYREGTLAEYRARPDFAKDVDHHPPLLSLWNEHEYAGHRWGMAIDLNKCIGCSACIVACQAENNIPVVGKSEVARGRDMHWIRVDRYFTGPPSDPQVAHQPVTCHQCENAPCEQVCPVAATVHDSEGLNVMVYNRCVGTRYCSNNCPYKVRRFNFFNNHKHVRPVEKMHFNPDVTVRSRGVMEKCSFCMQRIHEAKIAAKNERREIVDGEITPACAQACPTQAITFGDLNDPHSRVRKQHEDPRGYAMLAELNVKPRLHYLARLRNPAGGVAGSTEHRTL